ncbi:unnamed protein product, partial [Rotaria sp. Silwood2]
GVSDGQLSIVAHVELAQII